MSNNFVRKSYNIIAKNYERDRNQFNNGRYLERLNSLIFPCSSILDIGCGTGKPIDQYLVSKGHKVTGIDISEEMIKLAENNVPDACYQLMNMSDLKYNQFSVDVIVSFYAIFHTVRESHALLFKKMRSFLKSNGLLLVTMGSSDRKLKVENYYDVPMYWSQFKPRANRNIIEGAGFEILLDEIDDSGNQHHQIVLAKAKRDPASLHIG